MTPPDFKKDWEELYPGVYPVSFLFKDDLNHLWFRVHSLPESKRYAEEEEEWTELLDRHNAIMSELIGKDAAIYMVALSYEHENYKEIHRFSDVESVKAYAMTPHEPIDLQQIDPECWSAGSRGIPMVAVEQWSKGKFDAIFRDIANDNVRIFFFSPSQKRIVAPYDGGIDLVLEDEATKNIFREKYSAWLPQNDLGL
jgi:hypothetical protein